MLDENAAREEPVAEMEAPVEESPDRAAQPVDAEQGPRLAFPVVGIGASAGGLEAVSEFLSAMPPDSDIAFVLVQHLPPQRDSMLVDILAKRTGMIVRQVENGMPVEVNHLYVIRPGHVLTIREGLLHLGPTLGGSRAADRPIDDFFKSLAEEQRERAVCIIMSGMGSNGTAGAQGIKAVGGLCIAQEPESAQFPSMPRHLIDSGNADYILRPKDIPEVLLAYARHPYTQGAKEANAALALPRDREYLRDILIVLRNRTRTEFGGYKKPTLLRRIQRRMGVCGLTDMGEYVKLLRKTPTEVSALADDLLIHVTGFFRDADAWEALRTRVIVPLVGSRAAQEAIRCWVAACATGDEAYSLAMLLIEEAEKAEKQLDIKVFATDMAERTLAQARAGVFPGGIEAEVSPERLSRFFIKEDAVYRIRPEVRERVIFAPQNVLQDPPYSRLDITSCRNLLIYLEPDVQRRVLGLLHFGLREGGALFLGTSETIHGNDGLFEPIDKKARIFRRVGPTRHAEVQFPALHSIRSASGKRVAELAAETRPTSPPTFAQVTQRTLLERHMPAAVLVDREQRVLYFQGDTRPFLVQPTGEPTRDLMSLASEGIRGAARVALRRAAAEESTVTVLDGWLETEPGRRSRVALSASPALGIADHFVLSFEIRDDSPVSASSAAGADGENGHDAVEELRRVRDELQSTNEELQTSNEEMRAAVEEAGSVNEELQSTNEELETSKEEMQSLNEELSTVNAQLQGKMDEHRATSNDLASLLSSTELAVLFLDTRMRIRRFTPSIRELLDLQASDAGRPLSDFAMKFTDPDLPADAKAVLKKLVPIEREIAGVDGRWFIRRITPYRTAEDRIEGLVIAFVDVTLRVQTAARLAETARLLDLSNDAIIIRDVNNRITYWNHGAAELFGWSAGEAVGKDLHRLLRTESELPMEQLIAELRKRDRMTGEVVQFARDGRRITLLCRWAMDRTPEGVPASILTTATDISDRKRAEEVVAGARREAEAANVMKDEFLATLSHELRTPLSSILLWCKLLSDASRARENIEEGLAAIRKSAESQKEIIDDLLDTSRITAGKVRLEVQDVDMPQLVREAVDTIRTTAEARGVILRHDLDPKVGVVSADPGRLQQVIWNLVNNAVKFTPSAGTVDVRLHRTHRTVELRVIDTGEGISAEFLPHVFAPFRQADGSSTRRHGGLGLGLAICRQLVELHGGTIRAESAGIGKGATFIVQLPLPAAKPSKSASPRGRQSRTKQQTTRREQKDALGGVRLLLVEDDPGTRRALSIILTSVGAAVTEVDSAAAALESIEASRPSALLCDIGLPGMDGRSLLSTIRAQDVEQKHEPLPAVALSAFARDDDVRRALDVGFDYYLRKPVDPAELVTTIAKCIAERNEVEA